MELLLQRNKSGKNATISPLLVDGEFECYILEDVVREIKGRPVNEWKVFGETAIPEGRYQVIITMSPRFNKKLPLLMDVPGFVGVRVHSGNFSTHTEGCLITGQNIVGESVTKSKAALDKLQTKLQNALDDHEQIWLTIKNA